MEASSLIHSLLEKRNARETNPFIDIIASNVSLNATVLDLQNRLDVVQRENRRHKQDVHELTSQLKLRGPTKTELKLRDKIQQLEEQLNNKRDMEVEFTQCKKTNKVLQNTITTLKENITKKEMQTNQLNEQLEQCTKQIQITEKQFHGLQETNQRLLTENDTLQKQYDEMEGRILEEKEKFVDLMNKMNLENEELKKKIEMLIELNQQEKKRFMWSAVAKKNRNKNGGVENDGDDDVDLAEDGAMSGKRKFGDAGVVIPTTVSLRIGAHQRQITCVGYDSVEGNSIATASEDSTVKLWNTGNGRLLKTFRGGSSNVMLGLAVCGSLIAGCGTDKMCRIWNLRSERLIHQLVGHSQKITSTCFINGDRSILTSSADRSMKVWDITRNTYRQTVTMRHSSTTNCTDVSYDSVTAVSGHLDGGVRFWDVRTSERTADITDLHCNNGGVTSVKFNPTNNAQVLTTGRDSIMKLIDVRKAGEELQSFSHTDFNIDLSYASCAISPDGKYAAAGSSNGEIFIWKTLDGNLERHLKGYHDTGVVSVAWNRGGSNGQQFASVDKRGCLLLWA